LVGHWNPEDHSLTFEKVSSKVMLPCFAPFSMFRSDTMNFDAPNFQGHLENAMLQRFSRFDTRTFYLSFMTSIHLPASVDMIGEARFDGCYSLDIHSLERNQFTASLLSHSSVSLILPILSTDRSVSRVRGVQTRTKD
jgi:hypothetical protein